MQVHVLHALVFTFHALKGGLALLHCVQVDWRAFQANHRGEWLSCLRKTFQDLDVDQSGRLSTETLVRLLSDKLPEGEVRREVYTRYGGGEVGRKVM